jgi:hypothetical protein
MRPVSRDTVVATSGMAYFSLPSSWPIVSHYGRGAAVAATGLTLTQGETAYWLGRGPARRRGSKRDGRNQHW